MSGILLASMTAFLVNQHLEVIQFHLWEQGTRGYLGLRNNASTMVSQLVDTTLSVAIASMAPRAPRF